MSATGPRVRDARAFLRTHLKAGTSDISPRLFANAADELGMSFEQLASTLARTWAGGQGESFYREQALEADLAGGGKS